MKDELGNSQSQVYSMTQNIERRCACFQEKCIARAVVNESVYVRQLNTSCQGPGSVLLEPTSMPRSYLGGLYSETSLYSHLVKQSPTI